MIPSMRAASELTAAEKLVEVLEVTRALTAEVDLDALLAKVVDAAGRVLDAERSTLYLIDPADNSLVSRIAQRFGSGSIRLPMGTGIAGSVAISGQPVILEDAHADPRFNPSFDLQSGFTTRDMLAVPVRNSRHTCIGVLQVMNGRGRRLGPADVSLLEALASSAGVALENARLYERIGVMLQSFVRTLAASIDARDPQTAGHSQRVGGYATRLAQEIGVTPAQQRLIYLSGLLHDYGKIGVPEAILTKPARLTDDEMQVMRGHPGMSREILLNVQFTEDLHRIPEIVYQHHERIDGGGYPRGLSGPDLCFEGRLLAVCDVFDALTARRYYREPITQAEAFAYIHDNSGTHFDPDVVAAFGTVLRRDGQFTEVTPADAVAAEEAVQAARAAGRM